MIRRLTFSIALFGLLLSGCAQEAQQQAQGVARAAVGEDDLLYVWSFDADEQSSDFLAVVEADASTPDYGRVVDTVPVGFVGGAHHTEHRMPSGDSFFANSFLAGTTFVFGLEVPRRPLVRESFVERGPFAYPHSFERLPSGNVLATFQNQLGTLDAPGGLAELAPNGRLLRSASARDAADPQLRPYSLAVLPELDRVVSTTADMRGKRLATSVQIWRLSDLELLETLLLPPGPRGTEQQMPAEPRVLPGGRRVLVSTFSCGLFLLDGLDGTEPSARFVHSFPYEPPHRCALAISMGRYWIQTVPTSESLVVLDVDDPELPEVVQELWLGEDMRPHWIASDAVGRRVVATGRGAMEPRVVMLDFDPRSGHLEVDTDFGEPGAELPGLRFDRAEWPHGNTGSAVPHGALFLR
ncbi:MAG: hypothetical protein AAGA81_13195 [Acidobacteriota bacterium]